MPLLFVRDNIVHMKTDAIVNAANSELRPGGGVCGSIFDRAGYDKMKKACQKIGGCAVGNAVMTPGFSLPAKYVIHAVGPVWQGGSQNEEALLRACYIKSLNLAKKHWLKSIAFPLISSGSCGYPKEEALQVAITAISSFLLKHDMTVYIVVYDEDSFCLSKKLAQRVERFIDDRYVQERSSYPHLQPQGITGVATYICPAPRQETSAPKAVPHRRLSDLLAQTEETFSQCLLRLIDERGKKDSEIYNRANLDRRLFSKIRSNKNYKPTKQTVLALCVALELSLDETKDLLGKAGLALTHTSKFDIILEYFISEGSYDIFEINAILFQFDQPLLGSL